MMTIGDMQHEVIYSGVKLQVLMMMMMMMIVKTEEAI